MKLRRWLGLGAAAGGAALGYALLEARWYTLRRVAVAVLPAGAAPLRLLHISDLHLTAGQRRKVEWVRGLADLAPDLVVATGDNYSSADAMEVALEALEPLLAFPGAFVLGSHDHYSAVFKNPLTYLAGRKHARQSLARTPDLPAEAFAGVLQRAGWHRLDNARASLRLGPAGLATDLVGLADPHMGWDRLPPPPARPAGQAAPDLVLGVVHAPYRSAVQALVDDAARLVLAGHTHGGQVALPGFGALVSNTDLPLRYASGLHRWPTGGWAEGAYLHVSAGLGTSPYAPFRLAARPEATWLKLTPAT